ncbi:MULTISPECIES: flagellar hook-associated protein FlgK [unclassified Herbaspirillum]|uniref:flagellar hook-associated protein FlgK n=1 Tax=unclassified Herbaspirillum TaxID=2624150 RepID=UPI000E2EC2AC|nr:MULTISPECIES: flagellar hook-associated protein FlgK [unclassified Herbaspirillum]RFB68715.1 flagellar hook-associated protein FlgK [Herbaspirillum sp. 3R-3a1]TFI05623.1 flagellar hook-associated protein FlgK [Herbaspirillum sp. 3R11]TFI13467.1 flagellar hook-associated protein FlgK [Herbaspirillum sp. 3R-11]TFI27509.1 flagellar hook-associated protein FlgK [Herbaspirillum sp. 3C11]
MATNIFSIGQSALAAAQAAQATTSHNISNATTPGYNRQVVVQSTAGGINYGYGFIGQGTQVAEIKRVYNDFLNKQVMASQTTASSLDSYLSQISQLNNLVADTSAGLSPALQDFFKSMQNLASTPNNDAARQAVLSAGSTLAARFQSLNDQMAQSRTSVNAQITSSIGSINSLATQIQELNQAIIKAQGSGGGAAPNDLLDQRDQAVADLNKIVKVTTLPQSNGSLSVFVGNGQPLVLGDQVAQLVATPADDDPTRLQVSIKTSSNATILLPDGAFTGGSLGGILQYRTETLDTAQNTLGRVAIAMASAFNAQHKLGQDQNGALGTDFFNVPVPSVVANTKNHTVAPLAAATATITNPSALSTSDYRLDFDGTNYSVTRLSDNNKTSSTTVPITIDGVQFGSTNMVANDSFLIKPTINGANGISVAITNTQKIAAGTPIVTSTNAVTDMGLVTTGNTGTGVVTSASVNKAAFTPNSTQTYTYSSGPNTLTLTPSPTGNVTVTTTAGVTTPYTPGTPIPYSPGATITADGVSFVLSGTPANNDKFVFSPKPANTGTATISAGTIDTNYAATPLGPTVKLGFTFNSTGSTLTPNGSVGAVVVTHTDGTTTNYAAGANIGFTPGDKLTTGGISFTITGQPANGDQFYVSPNTNGVTDNRNALALNALQTANTIGNTSFQGSYSQLVSLIGNKTNEITVTNKAENARLTAIQQEQQSESGVNQDEELSNMIKNQTAYQAAAKIIQAASDMLNVLFTLGG